MIKVEGSALLLYKQEFLDKDMLLHVFFKDQGKYIAILKWGQSKKYRSMLQIGNQIDISWLARINENLGSFQKPELISASGNLIIANPDLCFILVNLCAILDDLLQQRQSHNTLYQATIKLLDNFNQSNFLKKYIYWELQLLQSLGYGINYLDSVVDSDDDELIYLSPKTARMVGARKGEKYKDKLLKLPKFIQNFNNSYLNSCKPSITDLTDGLKITSHFLGKFVESKTLEKREMILNLVFKQKLF